MANTQRDMPEPGGYKETISQGQTIAFRFIPVAAGDRPNKDGEHASAGQVGFVPHTGTPELRAEISDDPNHVVDMDIRPERVVQSTYSTGLVSGDTIALEAGKTYYYCVRNDAPRQQIVSDTKWYA